MEILDCVCIIWSIRVAYDQNVMMQIILRLVFLTRFAPLWMHRWCINNNRKTSETDNWMLNSSILTSPYTETLQHEFLYKSFNFLDLTLSAAHFGNLNPRHSVHMAKPTITLINCMRAVRLLIVQSDLVRSVKIILIVKIKKKKTNIKVKYGIDFDSFLSSYRNLRQNHKYLCWVEMS